MQSEIPKALLREMATMWRNSVRDLLRNKPLSYLNEIQLAYRSKLNSGGDVSSEMTLFVNEVEELAKERVVIELSSYNCEYSNPFEQRLAMIVKAKLRGELASELHPDLPDKPGMSSAYAISTILSDPQRYVHNDAIFPNGIPDDCDPVGSGARWLTRLRRDIAEGKDRGEHILWLLQILDQPTVLG